MNPQQKEQLLRESASVRALVEKVEPYSSNYGLLGIDHVERELAGRAWFTRCCGERMIKIRRRAYERSPGLFGQKKSYTLPDICYCQKCGTTKKLDPDVGWVAAE